MTRFFALTFLLLLAASPATAGRPAPWETCSPSGNYCAMLNPWAAGDGIKVYGAGEKQAVLWSAEGFSDVAALADDGQHLVLAHGHTNFGFGVVELVPLNYDEFPILIFYRRGQIFRKIFIGDIMTDAEVRTNRDGEFYLWGEYLPVDEDGYFVLRTAAGREIRMDITTGREVR